MKVNRNNIKHNFLRRIILRLDYSGVVDIKDTLKELENQLPNLGFVEMNAEFINEAEFDIADPNMIESKLSIPIRDLNKIENFKYRNEGKNIILEVNKLYTSLTINTEQYVEFEKYSNIFGSIIKEIKNNNIYLNPTRLGLRKINDCIIKDNKKFNDYFEEKYFSDISKVLTTDGFDAEKVNTEFIDTMMHNNFMFNFVRVASGALLSIDGEEYDAYQVAVDIDGYTHDNIMLNEIISETETFKSELISINNSLFELYIKVLTEKFIEKLIDTDSSWDEVLGVNKND